MGVQGLLPMLKSVMDQVHVSKYKGKTVGIDACGWLYKGCYSCAADVVLRRETDVYLNFCVQQIKLLQELGIRPLFVFDGAPLPAKAELNASRYRMRKMWRDKALQSVAQAGEANTDTSMFNKAVSVSNDMIMKFIGVLRRMNIDYLVAPYEADAQLAYLSKLKIIDAVISEDSDCVPYGCRTVLFKWTGDGWASELKRRSLGANEDLSFVGWSDEMFVELCVLSGCDYCPSVSGIGIVTAYKLVNTHKTPIDIMTALRKQKGSLVPLDYEQKFYNAVFTFRHHLVFDPRDEKLTMLNPLNPTCKLKQLVEENLDFLGNLELSHRLVASIAHGDIHPVTHDSYAWKETEELQASAWPTETATISITSSNAASDCGVSSDSRVETEETNTRRCVDNATRIPIESGDESRCILPKQRNEDGMKKSQPSWRHLDSVLGASSHILNFRSPKVSESFRPLISAYTQTFQSHQDKTAEQLKVYETMPYRQCLKRVRHPRNRQREDQKSGFDGEVTCRVDGKEDEFQRYSQRRRLSERASAPSEYGRYASTQTILHGPVCVEPPPPDKKPAFFASNCQKWQSAPSVVEAWSPTDMVTSDPDLECQRAASDESLLSRGVFNAVSVRRAISAEEKWDHILGAEIGNSDGEVITPSLSPGLSASSDV